MNYEIAKHLEVRRTSAIGNISKGISKSYITDFKLMVVLYAEKTSNCESKRKYVTEANVPRWK